MGIVSLKSHFRDLAILSIIYGILFVFLNLFVFFVYPLYASLALIIGLSIGLGCGFTQEKRQLKSLEEKGEIKVTPARGLATLVLTVVAAIAALVLPVLLIPSSFYRNYETWRLVGGFGFTFLAPIAPTMLATRISIIKKWQQQNRSEVFVEQGMISYRIYRLALNRLADSDLPIPVVFPSHDK